MQALQRDTFGGRPLRGAHVGGVHDCCGILGVVQPQRVAEFVQQDRSGAVVAEVGTTASAPVGKQLHGAVDVLVVCACCATDADGVVVVLA